MVRLVRPGAVDPNLSLVPGEHPNSAELGHGPGEGLVEGGRAGGELVDGVPGAAIGEEHLIRREQTLPALQVLEVGVVECVGSGRVHVDGDPRVHLDGAHLLQLRRVPRVQGGVDFASGAEVVHAVREAAAVGESDGVGTG